LSEEILEDGAPAFRGRAGLGFSLGRDGGDGECRRHIGDGSHQSASVHLSTLKRSEEKPWFKRTMFCDRLTLHTTPKGQLGEIVSMLIVRNLTLFRIQGDVLDLETATQIRLR
jgi:hypothetical protein